MSLLLVHDLQASSWESTAWGLFETRIAITAERCFGGFRQTQVPAPQPGYSWVQDRASLQLRVPWYPPFLRKMEEQGLPSGHLGVDRHWNSVKVARRKKNEQSFRGLLDNSEQPTLCNLSPRKQGERQQNTSVTMAEIFPNVIHISSHSWNSTHM